MILTKIAVKSITTHAYLFMQFHSRCHIWWMCSWDCGVSATRLQWQHYSQWTNQYVTAVAV